MTDSLDLPPRYRRIVEALLREHVPEAEVWAYGSRVNGESHEGSDLDLVVRDPDLKRIPSGPLADLIEALEDSNVPILVQTHDWARLPESFHWEIERDYVVLQEGLGRHEVDEASQWQVTTWGELATLEYGKSLRGYELSNGPYRVYGTNGPIGWHNKALYPSPSVIIGRKGAYRGVHYCSAPFFVIDTAFYLKPKVEIDTRWAYYELLTQDINGMDSGSAIPSTSREDFYGLPVQVPPLPEQRAIAHVLGALDEKIELNRGMNETLEEMARALFKDWFVDFDPVRAKIQGRWRRGESLPGLPAEYYDLFPDCLVESELGEIPEGWEVKPLGECIDVERGLSYKGSGLSSSGMPMHNLNSIYEGGGYKSDGIKYYNGDHQPRHVTQPGDVIVANTEQGHHRFLIGFAAIVPDRLGNCGLFSHHLYRVRPKSSSAMSSDFLCLLLNTSAMHYTVSGYATGTTVNMLPPDALRIPSIVVPPIELMITFTAIAEGARIRREKLIAECQFLAAKRDALLPKLVSGQIRVGVEVKKMPIKEKRR